MIMEHMISHGHTATTVSQHGYGTHIYHRHTVTADPKKHTPKTPDYGTCDLPWTH